MMLAESETEEKGRGFYVTAERTRNTDNQANNC